MLSPGQSRVLCNNHIQLSKMFNSTKAGEIQPLYLVIQVYAVRRPILKHSRHNMHALRPVTRQGWESALSKNQGNGSYSMQAARLCGAWLFIGV